MVRRRERVVSVGKMMERVRRVHRVAQPHPVLRLVDRLLRQGEGEPRHLADARGDRERLRLQSIARDDAVDHADVERPLRVIRSPRKRNSFAWRGFMTWAWAKYSTPGIPIFTTGSAKKASSEAMIEIADPRQHQPAGDAGALHHGNRGLRDLTPAPAHAEIELLLADEVVLDPWLVGVLPPVRGDACERLVDVAPRSADVVAGGEVLPRAGEDDDLHRVVVDRRVEGGIERVGHLRVLGVAVLRPVHRHEGDVAARLVENGILFFDRRPLVRHQSLPQAPSRVSVASASRMMRAIELGHGRDVVDHPDPLPGRQDADLRPALHHRRPVSIGAFAAMAIWLKVSSWLFFMASPSRSRLRIEVPVMRAEGPGVPERAEEPERSAVPSKRRPASSG